MHMCCFLIVPVCTLMQLTEGFKTSVQGARLGVSVLEHAVLAEQSCMCVLQANTSGYQVILYGAGLFFTTDMQSVTTCC